MLLIRLNRNFIELSKLDKSKILIELKYRIRETEKIEQMKIVVHP